MDRPTTRHIPRALVLTLGATILAGCAASRLVPTPRPAVDAGTPIVVDPLSAPWTVEVASGSIRQEIRLDASLVSRVDTAERRDTLRTVVAAEWSRVTDDGPSRLAGLLTGYRVSADSTEPTTPGGLLLPVPFSALESLGASQVRFTSPDPTGCGPAAAATAVLRELFVTMPRRLELGTRWRDSSSFSLCRDSITISVHSAREFVVNGAERRDGHAVVLVERRSITRMRGEGHQFGEPVSVEAAGEGLARLAVRLTGGFVVSGDGESELRMTMRGRRRSQELTQRTRIEIVTP